MLLQRRGLLLCCGCGGSGAAMAAGGRAAALPLGAGDTSCTDDEDGQPLGNKSGPPRQVSWAQVEAMTGGFSWGVVGEGGFSTVYLGRLAGELAAVKVHRGGGSSERLQRAFRQELDALLRVRHPHVVRLLAFCCGEQQQGGGVLVLELAPNGNLHDHLHQKQVTMPWGRRVSVALQVARALEYLHDELQVVHGDVKASNVLLDAAMAARLCDFGSAAFSAFSKKQKRPVLLGSPGYVDPHYLRSGVLTSKSDVYSFGVLLLELLTGVQPFRHARPLLTPALVDRRLGCRYHAAEAAAMLPLAAACVGDNPTLRPSMADVVRTLQRTAGRRSIGRQ